ncbi:hypothetical protein [Streptomyces sp. NPDC059786]|uniref:hypothetical protein n=1 Tax=Streptomyces sp. NPDC059786 TaxID=3346946 RepID=UPI0036523578
MTDESLTATTTEPAGTRGSRHRALLLMEAAVAMALALAATVWACADPYIDLESKAWVPRIALATAISVAMSTALVLRGGPALRKTGWALTVLRAPVLLNLLWFLLPQVTSELL